LGILEKGIPAAWGWNPGVSKLLSIAGTAGLNEKDFAAARLAYMGNYADLMSTKYGVRKTTLLEVAEDLQAKNGLGKITGDVISFPETSHDNNMIMQIFEFPENEAKINKLAIIDAGELSDGNPYGQNQHLFYVGKMYRVKNEEDTSIIRFANIFTIVMHSSKAEDAFGNELFMGMKTSEIKFILDVEPPPGP
jgi:hypothetical protein